VIKLSPTSLVPPSEPRQAAIEEQCLSHRTEKDR
jgi:hypothetical protein